MKLPQNLDIEDYKKAIGIGALKGAGVGVFLSGAIYAVLSRKTQVFRQAGAFHKTLLIVSPVVFCGVTSVEYASREFEEHQREKLDGYVSKGEHHKSVGIYDAITQFLKENKYKVIVGGWATSLAGSFYLVNQNKYLSRSQKLVQARVYAQGATVAMLLATVFLSVGTTEKEKRAKKEGMKSQWLHDLEFNKEHRHGSGGLTGRKEQLPERLAHRIEEADLRQNAAAAAAANENTQSPEEVEAANADATKSKWLKDLEFNKEHERGPGGPTGREEQLPERAAHWIAKPDDKQDAAPKKY